MSTVGMMLLLLSKCRSACERDPAFTQASTPQASFKQGAQKRKSFSNTQGQLTSAKAEVCSLNSKGELDKL